MFSLRKLVEKLLTYLTMIFRNMCKTANDVIIIVINNNIYYILKSIYRKISIRLRANGYMYTFFVFVFLLIMRLVFAYYMNANKL